MPEVDVVEGRGRLYGCGDDVGDFVTSLVWLVFGRAGILPMNYLLMEWVGFLLS